LVFTNIHVFGAVIFLPGRSAGVQLVTPAHANCLPICRDGKLAVDENKKPIPPMSKGMPRWKASGHTDAECSNLKDQNRMPEGECFLAPGAVGPSHTAEKIALYHFGTKSLEDFTQKMLRGSGMSKATKRMEYFTEIAGCAHLARCGVVGRRQSVLC
jgi:hypothetical protein